MKSRFQRVTIADVAKRAGVSPSSVSKALNGRPGVSPRTKAIVETAARELNYTPNIAARQLVSGRTNTIGLLLPNVANPYFGAIARHTCQLADREGFDVIIVDFGESAVREARGLELLQQKRVDGLLIAGGRFTVKNRSDEKLLRASEKMPGIVLLNGYIPGSSIYSVRIDEEKVGRMVAEHYVKQGYRSFLVVTGPMDRSSSVDKMRGFQEAMQAAGVSPNQITTINGNFTTRGAYQATASFLESDPKIPLAVFALSDLMAFGVIRAIHEKGLSIPDDAAVIGYDGLDISAFHTPALSTMACPIKEMVSLGFDVLLRVLSGSSPRQREYILEASLIERETTPPAASSV